MTSEGNVADTGVVEKANQLIRSGEAPDMVTALKILKEQAKRDRDNEEKDKIKTTQKARKYRGSRHSGKQKKMKKKKR
jgi:Bacterial toxin 34